MLSSRWTHEHPEELPDHYLCECVPDHSVLLHGSLHLRKKSMEDQPDHLHGNAVFHGNPVPGSYDPADLYLRWNIWNPEPQSNIDIHASGLLGIYGGIHVPGIYQRRCTDLTGRGSTDWRSRKTENILSDCVPSVKTDHSNTGYPVCPVSVERLPAAEPDPDR